jgi:hypothetical protein
MSAVLRLLPSGDASWVSMDVSSLNVLVKAGRLNEFLGSLRVDFPVIRRKDSAIAALSEN